MYETKLDRYLAEYLERIEKEGEKCDSSFKKKILQNAPESDEDFIITEKGGWK